MDTTEYERRCPECDQTEFHIFNGEYVCVECNTSVPDRVESGVNDDEGPGITGQRKVYRTSDVNKDSKLKSKKAERLDQEHSWDIYDGFNYILVKMVDSLIRCGAKPTLKPLVHKLWAGYLCKMEIAYCGEPEIPSEGGKSKDESERDKVEEQPSFSKINENASPAESERDKVEEQPSFSKINENASPAESEDQNSTFKHPIKRAALFAPKKIPRKCPKPRGVNLVDIPDDTSVTETREKNRAIRKKFMELALSASGEETDVSIASSSASSDGESADEGPGTRLSTMKPVVPECFPDTGEGLDTLKRRKKTEDYTAPKSTCTDPEYMTLHKLLSFLHAALLMEGQLISSGDLTRWVREGFIPLYGAHQLLPKKWVLSRREVLILGGMGFRCVGAPGSRMFRQNTARLLGFLQIGKLPRAPPFVLASKIIVDLQLPNELEVHVRTMDRMVNGPGETEWKTSSYGNRTISESSYAGALLLVSLKFIFGLDGDTEYKISDFAMKVNNLLNLKPSSGFARQQHGIENADLQESSSGIKTLFVWREWVRFIEYRKMAINSTHVPTAIRRKLVDKMDPDYVLHFAKNEGYYHCHRPKSELTADDKHFLEIFEKGAQRFPSPSEKKIPTFRPRLFGSQGLDEQLLEFDHEKYGLLKQEFSASSLMFSKKPELLAGALKKASTPHRLNIHKGSANKESILTMPFISSRSGLSKKDKNMDRYCWKIVTQEPEVISVSTLSDDEEDGDSKPTLVLYEPSSAYWINAHKSKLMSFDEWNLFSAGLPPTFLWMLELICESIEESPRDFYEIFIVVEQIIFFQHAHVKRSLCTKEELKIRLLSALRSEI